MLDALKNFKNTTNASTRLLRYLKRKRSAGRIAPIRVTKEDLAELRSRYDAVTEQFAAEMAEYAGEMAGCAVGAAETAESAGCAGEQGETAASAAEDDCESLFPQRERFTGYDILSFNGDRMGKVLGKDGVIYRGIYSEKRDDFREMWKSGLLQVLSSHGWIPKTEISGFYTDEYPIILRHETVDMNASKLWSYNQVREAAIRISQIQEIAKRAGFTLHDGHLNNITYHRGKPVFTDIGSFVKDRGQKTVCSREIVFSGCYRCVFRQLGNFMLSRNQTYDEANNMIWLTPRYYDDLTEEYRLALRKFRAYHGRRSSWPAQRIIRCLFDRWDVRPEYIDALFPEETDIGANAYAPDVELITGAVRELGLPITSAVDIGGTNGRMSERMYREFARMEESSAGADDSRKTAEEAAAGGSAAATCGMGNAQKGGFTVTDCETDDDASDRAFSFLGKENVPGNVLAFHYLYGCDPDSRKSVTADLATAADITHNVFSVQQYRADSLLNSLRKMANRYVAVTYYPERPASEKYIRKMTDDGQEDAGDFVRVFEDFYEILLKREIPDQMGDGKGLLLVGRIR